MNKGFEVDQRPPLNKRLPLMGVVYGPDSTRICECNVEWATRIAAALNSTPPKVDAPTVPGCVWTPDEDGNWSTTCGNMHVFFDGTPHQNQYEFCPYCGKKLAQTEGEVPHA